MLAALEQREESGDTALSSGDATVLIMIRETDTLLLTAPSLMLSSRDRCLLLVTTSRDHLQLEQRGMIHPRDCLLTSVWRESTGSRCQRCHNSLRCLAMVDLLPPMLVTCSLPMLLTSLYNSLSISLCQQQQLNPTAQVCQP